MTLFENLELTNQDDNRERRQAATLSNSRAKARFSRFLLQGSVDEWDARFALVADEFNAMVRQACSEVGYNDPVEIGTIVSQSLRTANLPRLKHFPARGKPGSYNEQCRFTGKRPEAGQDWGMLIQPGGGMEYVDPEFLAQNHGDKYEDIGQGVTAATVNDGDTYTQEQIDLPSNESGDFGGAYPEMDKSLADNEPFIDVPSAQHPTEHQAIDEVGAYDTDFDPSDLGLIDTIDVEKPLQPELTKGETGVFPAGNMAAPVTSAKTSDMITHPAAQDLVAQDYTPGSIQDWASQLDKMGLSAEDAWKAITEHFQRKTDDAHNATDAPEESMGLSDEDLAGMSIQGDQGDDTLDAGPRHSKWRLI